MGPHGGNYILSSWSHRTHAANYTFRFMFVWLKLGYSRTWNSMNETRHGVLETPAHRTLNSRLHDFENKCDVTSTFSRRGKVGRFSSLLTNAWKMH